MRKTIPKALYTGLVLFHEERLDFYIGKAWVTLNFFCEVDLFSFALEGIMVYNNLY